MKRIKVTRDICILFLFISLSLLSAAYAGSPDELDVFINTAVTSNPEILSAKRAFESSAARIPQSASLSDPMLEFEHDRMSADRMLSGRPMDSFAVSQDIPFPAKLYLRAKISAAASRIAYQKYKAKEEEIISEVKRLYYELVLLDKTISLEQEDKVLLNQLYAAVTARYAAGQTSQSDALKAQVELARVDSELIMLTQRRLSLQARMNVLLDRDPATSIDPVNVAGETELKDTLSELSGKVIDNNPELQAYKYAIERGKTAYTLSLNGFMPDFKVKFKQMINKGSVKGGAWAGMVGVTIPLWFLEKQVFGVKEMRSELEMVKAEYKARENFLLFELNDAYSRAEANMKLAGLYEAAFIPQAQQALNTAMKGYEAAQTDFLDVLDGRRMLIDFKLQHYKALLEFRTALADIERLTGGPENFSAAKG